MGAPEIILLSLLASNLANAWQVHRSGEDPAEFPAMLIGTAIWIVLLVWGGFFD